MEELEHIYRAALELQTFCQSRHWRFCFIGGIAVQRWGEPRMTQDADITLITGFGDEVPFIDALLATFSPRRPDTREFSLKARVVLLQTREGTPLDVALGAVPFEERSVERSSLHNFGISGKSISLQTCSAEDLVIHKCFANRRQDWLDVERILQRQGKRLDFKLIREELSQLVALKEQPEIMDTLATEMSKLGLN